MIDFFRRHHAGIDYQPAWESQTRLANRRRLLVFTGVQLITLGLLAEMQVRTYHESQGKATYVIRDILETPPAA